MSAPWQRRGGRTSGLKFVRTRQHRRKLRATAWMLDGIYLTAGRNEELARQVVRVFAMQPGLIDELVRLSQEKPEGLAS